MKSTLTYTSSKGSVTLLSGELPYVDLCIGTFYNYDDLAYDSDCWTFIKPVFDGELSDSNFQLVVSRHDGVKEELPLIFNDREPIYINSNYYENKFSEVDKSRKLLFSSKDKKFMRNFLSNDVLSRTASFMVRVLDSEANYIILNNLDIPIINAVDGTKRVFVIDVFKASLEQKKLGKLRDLFEASIDMWSDKLKEKTDDELYYYSRNLRLIMIDYRRYTTLKNVKQSLELQKNLKKC